MLGKPNIEWVMKLPAPEVPAQRARKATKSRKARPAQPAAYSPAQVGAILSAVASCLESLAHGTRSTQSRDFESMRLITREDGAFLRIRWRVRPPGLIKRLAILDKRFHTLPPQHDYGDDTIAECKEAP